MTAGVSLAGVCFLGFLDDQTGAPTAGRLPRHGQGTAADDELPILDSLREQLAEYFAGTRRAFDLPLAAAGSAFQRRVWQALGRIPYGATRSYGELARELGVPGGSRAVGSANGRNPIAIVIPCHRVIAEDGTLGGYGGGLWRKRRLLELEGAFPASRAGGESAAWPGLFRPAGGFAEEDE